MSTIAVSTRRFPVVQSFIRPLRLHTGATLLSKGKRARVRDIRSFLGGVTAAYVAYRSGLYVQTSTTSPVLVISFARYHNTGSEFVLVHLSLSISLSLSLSPPSSVPESFKRVCSSCSLLLRSEMELRDGIDRGGIEIKKSENTVRSETWLPRYRGVEIEGAPFDVRQFSFCSGEQTA